MTSPRITLSQLLFPRLRSWLCECAAAVGTYYAERPLP